MNDIRLRNVVIKGVVLFLAANLVFGLFDLLPILGRVSAYNRLFPGRTRLPYGERPDRAYNLSLFNLEAMFASHELAAGPKPDDEFRVLLIGDSSAWGFLLRPDQTLSANINAKAFTLPDGRRVRAYNLGYPVMSLTKDLVVLSYGMQYEPDLIVWPLTLESFPIDKQLFPPLLQNNPAEVRALIAAHDLRLDPNDPLLADPSFFERTIAGQRRSLADLARLQLYGILWAATGIDQDIPDTYTPRMEDLPPDESFHDLLPPRLHPESLALDVLQAGSAVADDTPILFVNEPMFISQGENSQIRYNFYYPRWAYDDYRRLMLETTDAKGWLYLDLWDAIPASEFTNSAVHINPEGTAQFAALLAQAIVDIAVRTP